MIAPEMPTLKRIRVRNAHARDLEAMLALVPRLRDFGPDALRPIEDLDRAEQATLTNAARALPEDALLVVAERTGHSEVAGVAYAETVTDYFTRERHGHLAILIVASDMEGQGVGRALLDAVDHWCSIRHYRLLTLNVFAANVRARQVYERAGFRPDTVRYVKEIQRLSP